MTVQRENGSSGAGDAPFGQVPRELLRLHSLQLSSPRVLLGRLTHALSPMIVSRPRIHGHPQTRSHPMFSL